MSLWKQTGKTSLYDGEILREELHPDGVHRVTVYPRFEVAPSEREARQRLADRLERLAEELRK